MPPTSDWQPAIIASKEHVLRSHPKEHGSESNVTKFNGERVRVRRNNDRGIQLAAEDRRRLLGCSGESLEVHPDDAQRLWPEYTNEGYTITLCEHALYMD